MNSPSFFRVFKLIIILQMPGEKALFKSHLHALRNIWSRMASTQSFGTKRGKIRIKLLKICWWTNQTSLSITLITNILLLFDGTGNTCDQRQIFQGLVGLLESYWNVPSVEVIDGHQMSSIISSDLTIIRRKVKGNWWAFNEAFRERAHCTSGFPDHENF